VKIVRPIAFFLAAVVLLAVVFAAVAIAPPFQTWYARLSLNERPELRASLGSISAAFGRVDVEDFKAEVAGAVLTLPTAEARLPILRALGSKRVQVRTLVAKGWTLDLSGVPEAAVERQLESHGGDAAAADPVRLAEAAIAAVLGGSRLPFDVSLDAVDLEGDLVIPQGAAPAVRMHIVIDGGGFASGKTGSAALTAELNPVSGSPSALKGTVTMSMDTPRTISGVAANVHVSRDEGPFSGGLAVDAAARRSGIFGAQVLSISFTRNDGRVIFALGANLSKDMARIAGTWRADIRREDVAAFAPAVPLPRGEFSGKGQFDANAGFTDVHADGRISATLTELVALSPALARFGAERFAADFDGERNEKTLSFRRLEISASGAGGSLTARLLQPCSFGLDSRSFAGSDSSSALAEVEARAMPLSWIPAVPGGLTFDSGAVTAEMSLRAAPGGYVLGSKAPVAASGITIAREGKPLVTGGEIVGALSASSDDKGLHFKLGAGSIREKGAQVASMEIEATKAPGSDQPVTYSGTLQSDLPDNAASPLGGLPWLRGRKVTTSFTGSAGSAQSIQAKFDVFGPAKGVRISGTVNEDSDSADSGEFLAPIKIESGGTTSEVSLEGSWRDADGETRTDIKVSGEHADLGNLLQIVPPVSTPAGKAGAALPFWGAWRGQLAFDFDSLRAMGRSYEKVAGTLGFESDSLELMGGRADVAPRVMASAAGTVSFSPGRQHPYTLKGTIGLSEKLDASVVIPPKPDESPVVEGHYSLAGSVSGTGSGLADLSANTTERFELTSLNGIVRLLAVDVADAVPEANAPVSDSAAEVGNLVGSFFGAHGKSFDLAKNKLSSAADAVISFTNQVSEIGYDKVTVSAERMADGSVRLLSIEMVSPDAHLTGTGFISHVAGTPLAKEPLSLDLRLGVRRVSAKYLSEAGLLSAEKDALGYSLLNGNIHLGGTIDRLDKSQWHDLLAAAIRRSAPKADSKKR
jgi:hypothetical protein